jgi:hypothetical protein
MINDGSRNQKGNQFLLRRVGAVAALEEVDAISINAKPELRIGMWGGPKPSPHT